MLHGRRAVLTVALGFAVSSLLASAVGAAATTRSTAASTARISSSECAANRAAGVIKFLSPFGTDASAGIIDVDEALALGYFKQLCLNVNFIANAGTDGPYAAVSSGAATVTGEGSAADELAAVAQGQHFVGIATYGDTSDYAIMTKPNITKLTQLEGKPVGYHTVLPVVLQEMFQNAGVPSSKLHLVNDNSYDPTLLIRGTFAGLQAYQTNEPLTLRADHDAVKVWTPAQFGVAGTFNVEIVNANFLKEHRGAVVDFLRAELHAFDYCAVHQSSCVTNEQGKGSSNIPHALAEWKLEVSLAQNHTLPGKGVGVESIAEWTPELHALVAAKLVKSVPSLSVAEDPSIASSLYHGKTLIWP